MGGVIILYSGDRSWRLADLISRGRRVHRVAALTNVSADSSAGVRALAVRRFGNAGQRLII